MSVLKINMTYQCTANCDHCRFRCDTSPHSVIDFDLAMSCVKDLKEHNDLQLVVILGGEPGLFPELTHRLVAGVCEMGLGARVETNAFYATSEEAASQFLGPLYANGCSTMFSLDAHHEPFVSPNCVERAIRVTEKLGGQYNLEMAYVVGPGNDNGMDTRTDELLADLEWQLGHPVSSAYKGGIFYTGRAADTIAAQVAKGRGVPKEVCNTAPWWHNGSFETLELLILDSEGYLTKGCGVVIGNIKDKPTFDVIHSFDARQHPIFSVLIEQGPYGLVKLAAEMGHVIKEDYADKCHLCQEARDVLWTAYPEHLVPTQKYQLSGS